MGQDGTGSGHPRAQQTRARAREHGRIVRKRQKNDAQNQQAGVDCSHDLESMRQDAILAEIYDDKLMYHMCGKVRAK